MELKHWHKKICCAAIGLLLFTEHARAQNAQEQTYSLLSGSLRAMTGQSDNSYKTYTDKLAEQQNEYGLDLNSRYSNSFMEFDAGYQMQEQQFAKESQVNKSTLEGRANFLLGKPTDMADLRLSHSRSTLLKAPTQVNLTNNQEEREIFTATPTLRARLSPADRLQLTGDLTNIKFLESDLLNSSRQGLNATWLHSNSAIQKMQISLQTVDVKFKNLVGVDYSMQQAMLGYRVKLRKLNYAIDLGYNQSEPEAGEAFNSPVYTVTLGYSAGLQDFTLSSGQVITDTSFGGGNGSAVSGLPTSDGSGQGTGRLKREDSRFGWTSDSFCARCSLAATVFEQRDTYLETANKVDTQTGGNLDFSYRFTDAANVRFFITRSKMKFDGAIASTPYVLTLARAEYTYAFRGGLSMSLQYEEERRKQEIKIQSYLERFLGISLAYAF